MKYINYKNKLLTLCTTVFLCSALLCGCFFDSSVNTVDTTSSELFPTLPSVKLSDEAACSDYGYNTLDTEQKKTLYAFIDEYADKAAAEEFSIEGEATVQVITEVLAAYLNDNPQVFWIDDSFKYGYEADETIVSLCFTYENSELIELKSEFDEVVSDIVTQAKQKANSFEAEVFVNDYLVDTCEYDDAAAEASLNNETLANEHNAYGALVDKKAVCDGYAKAFQLLCNELGIECVTVNGYANGDRHAWNCVKFADKWYHVDVTWNDDVQSFDVQKYFYLNLSDEQILSSHTINEKFSELSEDFDTNQLFNCYVPECTGTQYNYLTYSSPTLTDIDDNDELKKSLASTAAEGKGIFVILADKSLDLEATADSLVNDGYLIDWVKYANSQNDSSHQLSRKFKVYYYDENSIIVLELIYD